MSIPVNTPFGTPIQYTNGFTSFQGVLFKSLTNHEVTTILVQVEEKLYLEKKDFWTWCYPRIIRIYNSKYVSIFEYKDDLDNWI